MTENSETRHEHRLRSWKEIAAFFGTDERTVKRWEVKRGLPVQRVPGGSRTPVYADVAELEQWIGGAQRVQRPKSDARPSRLKLSLIVGAFAIGLIAIALTITAGLVGSWSEPQAIPTASHRPPREAVNLYLAGQYNWERRTPESLVRAVHLFGQAINRDPEYAEAYAGLANCYLLMREYTRMPSEEAYALASAAAERALALNPDLSDAHAAWAYVAFYGSHDFARARIRFQRAVALDPRSVHARHWYATALLHLGDAQGALNQIEYAQSLDPHSRAILADKGFILFHAGRSSEAVTLLKQIETAEPDFLSPHTYLAVIYLAESNHRDWLREARVRARMLGDEARLDLLNTAERALRENGIHAMLRAVLSSQLRLYEQGGNGAYEISQSYALLGDSRNALRYLETAVARRDPEVVGARIEPAFRNLHGNPEYHRILRAIGFPA